MSVRLGGVQKSNDSGLSSRKQCKDEPTSVELSESLVRQMLQAQNDQLRAQAVQLQQMGAMLQDAIKLATTTAQQVQSAASSAAPAAGTADGQKMLQHRLLTPCPWMLTPG